MREKLDPVDAVRPDDMVRQVSCLESLVQGVGELGHFWITCAPDMTERQHQFIFFEHLAKKR